MADIETTDTVLLYFGDYLRLVKMGSLVNMSELNGDLSPFLHLYRRIKKGEGLRINRT